MKDEYISLSIAGAVGLASGGALIFSMVMGNVDVPHVIMIVMLALVLRSDARTPTLPGEYNRGWFVWRRVGPVKSSDDDGVSA